jgi:NAD(P)-dependent dehydrogenase (short-subunit alcohol dehydrogenase family)
MSVCLITGASRGIGRACALLAAVQGFDVAVNYAQDAKAAEEVVRAVSLLGRHALSVQADVSNEAQVLAMFERVDVELGPLGALVNNAGVVAPKARLDEMSFERWQQLFGVNVLGTLLCSREAVKRLSTRRGGTGGCIVNVGSVASRIGSPAQYVDYAASKGAVDAFTLGLSKEVAAEGIRVNCVRPGIIDTDIHASGGEPDRAQASAPNIPMQRPGSAQEVASMIVWLLSAEASYTTGAIIDVAGGR